MRALKNEGQKAFSSWIDSLHENPDSQIPLSLLEDDATSFEVLNSPDLPSAQFSTKLELAEALVPVVSEIEASDIDHDCWPRIWDAMALQFFDSICPVDSEGHWKPKNISHYIFSDNYKVRHRHRISGPVTLLKTGGESVAPFFKVEPSIHGDFEEQIGSRQEIAGNSTALEVLKALYVKSDGSGIATGYTTTKKSLKI